ncbi:hypothetical protein ACFL1N_17445 [Thermodesulfobacteriota bacterium]
MENYVPWYSDIYKNPATEYQDYDSADYIPVICRIDPRNPEEYIDKSIGGPDPDNPAGIAIFTETFYNRLLDGLGDIDSDGMPDEWEREYGLDALSDDADEDLDGDNFSNLNEYLKETLPNDAESHPPRFMPWLPLLLEDD